MDGEIRLLHVDDEPAFLDLAATFLERENAAFTVETATSVAEGLELLSEEFDGIISDYDMPGTDGLEFLERVRGAYPELPFVLFTGQGSEGIASDAISAGVTDYLQKGGGTDQYTVLANRVRNAVEQYRSKQALEASQKRLSLFIEQSPLGVLEYDEDFEIVRVNEVGEEILGYSEAELRGHTWEELVTEESYETVDEITDRLAAGTGGYHSIDENVRKDGERIICEWHNRIVTDDDGETVAVFSQFQDVTEREERKEELQRERDRFKTLFESLPVAAIRSRFEDGEPIVRQVNPAFEETFGYDAETLVGANIDSYVIPDGATRSGGEINRELFETGRVSRQVSRRTVDGVREFHAEIVLIDSEAETPEAYAIYVDITDDIRARRRLEALFGNSPDMIDIHDAEGTILDANERFCEELGYTESEVVGSNAWDIDRKVDRAAAHDLWEAIDINDPVRLETVFERRDGSTFPVEVHLVRLDIQGEDRFMVISREITDRKERERELERQNERLEEFAEVLSHDLRNPLSVAEGRLELAPEECETDDIDAAAAALDRMGALIEDVLTVARDGQSVTDPEPVDLAATVESSWRNVDTGTAEIVVGTDRTILADEGRLRRLFENLLRNSVEHGSTSSRTESDDAVEHGSDGVTTTVGDLEDGFYVEDDGPGIPEDERTAVFEDGYSTDSQGVGFGLSIVGEIVEAHDWTIRVTESCEGGARFEITGVDVLEADADQ
jgi:PAS domain S-box-containing protein